MKTTLLKTLCLLIIVSPAALLAAPPVASPSKPPPAPGFQTREQVMAALQSGQIKTVPLFDPLPPDVKFTMDITYGSVGDRPLKLDLYAPSQKPKSVPALIFIHGGAWQSGNKRMYRVYAIRYAQRGYVVACIGYRLSNEDPFPAAVEDSKCAVRWIRAHASEYGVDPNRLCVLGGSAGGHLAMMVGYSPDDKSLEGAAGHPTVSSRVQAVVTIYGPCDLTVPAARDVDVVRKFLQGKTYDQAPELYRQASPFHHLSSDDPPTLILHGTLDELVPIAQSDRLARRLKTLKIKHTYDRLEGWPHVMDLAQPVYRRCTWFIDRFLDQHLPPVPPPQGKMSSNISFRK